MNRVKSRDGTTITFDRLGDGYPVIVVGGQLCDRSLTRPTADDLAVLVLARVNGSLAVRSVPRHHSPFISSRGSTPNASASLRMVEAWAGRRPSSSLLMVS